MSDMGSFYVPIASIPATLLEQIGVESEDVQRFMIADGRVLERRIGFHCSGWTNEARTAQMLGATLYVG